MQHVASSDVVVQTQHIVSGRAPHPALLTPRSSPRAPHPALRLWLVLRCN